MSVINTYVTTINGRKYNASTRRLIVNESSLLFNTEKHPYSSNEQEQIQVLVEHDDFSVGDMEETPIGLLLPIYKNPYYTTPLTEEETTKLESNCTVCGEKNKEGKTFFSLKYPERHKQNEDITINFSNTTITGVCTECISEIKTVYKNTLNQSSVVSHLI